MIHIVSRHVVLTYVDMTHAPYCVSTGTIHIVSWHEWFTLCVDMTHTHCVSTWMIHIVCWHVVLIYDMPHAHDVLDMTDTHYWSWHERYTLRLDMLSWHMLTCLLNLVCWHVVLKCGDMNDTHCVSTCFFDKCWHDSCTWRVGYDAYRSGIETHAAVAS